MPDRPQVLYEVNLPSCNANMRVPSKLTFEPSRMGGEVPVQHFVAKFEDTREQGYSGRGRGNPQKTIVCAPSVFVIART